MLQYAGRVKGFEKFPKSFYIKCSVIKEKASNLLNECLMGR